MKPATKSTRHRKAFTIVELLTVMSIIVILIGLLLPALSKVRKYATNVKQMAQLRSIDVAIELFSNENGGYPPSSGNDPQPVPYCGAMKLSEAIMGKDLLGFHSNSVFRRDGWDVTRTFELYPVNATADNLKARKGPYLQAENANCFRIESIYTTSDTFDPQTYVLCDVYEREMLTKQKTGMPILYYKANTANSIHDPNFLPSNEDDSAGNIYNYWDNQRLVMLGKPFEGNAASKPHQMVNPQRFYQNTRSDKIPRPARPFRPDTYLLMSAGWDGEYGTADDICNYDWKYR